LGMQPGCTIIDEGLNSPLLSAYRLCERQAILVHKYYLGIEMGNDPGLARAVKSWETRYADLWRRQNHLAECQEQIGRIEEHRRQLSREIGQEIPWETAARIWIGQHAAEWRRHHEQQPQAV
jgi:hypothetical protein